MSKCENCGNEHIEIITKEVGYVCGKCGRNTVELAKQHIMNFDELSGSEVEVIGNIFDNPEL